MSRPLLEILAPVLGPDESVVDVTTGEIPVRRMGANVKRGGLVVATSRRVLLYTEKLGGYDCQDFAYGLLSSLDYKKGIFFGNLDLAVAGDRIRVTRIPSDDIEAIARVIRDKMAVTTRAERPGDGNGGRQSVADQVRDLAKLRDEGLISEEEFERKRKELLGL